ncbi:uncharacterized protein B0H18DRAFT_1107158, partial [Fomitopsis serialis]|uniref:uncharacterized protein n=1 Tax=Fomitopsis serialis TaxID=139415 RepID=UPI00200789FF
MAEQFREFEFRVLLASHPNDSATSAPASKYRYLAHACYVDLPSKYADISNLMEAALNTARAEVDPRDVDLGGTMKADIYLLAKPLEPDARTKEQYKELCKNVDEPFLNKTGLKLSPQKLLNGVTTPKNLVAVVIRVPAAYPAFINQYRDVFIEVTAFGSFDETDLDLNDIRSGASDADFVKEFHNMLDRKPGLTEESSKLCGGSQLWADYALPYKKTSGNPIAEYGSVEETSIEHEPSRPQEEIPWRLVHRPEVCHINWAAFIKWGRFWQSSPGSLERALTEDAAHALFSFGLMDFVPEDRRFIAS